MNEHRVRRFPEFSSLMLIRIAAAYLLRRLSWDTEKAHFLPNALRPFIAGPFSLWSTSNQQYFLVFLWVSVATCTVACQTASGNTADGDDDGVIVAQSTLSKWFMNLFFCLRRRCCEQSAIAIDKMEWRARRSVHTLTWEEHCLPSIAREIVDIKRNDKIHHLSRKFIFHDLALRLTSFWSLHRSHIG